MRTARAVPRVQVYSRHREDCKFLGKNKRIGCDCPKMLSFYRDAKLHRVTADTCDGEVAEQKQAEMQARFDAAALGEPVPVPAGKRVRSLDEAVQKFLETKRNNEITEKHIEKLRFELECFSRFALGKGLVNIGDIETEHVLEYRNALEGAQNTKAKKIFRLIGFFEFCVELGWISRNVARAESIRFKYGDAQDPKALTDAQFDVLLAAIRKVNGRTTDEQRAKLRSMIMLMRWTGLAIGDAVTMERSRFEKNGHGFYKLFLRRAKTGHAVYATMRAEVVEAVFAGANPDGRWLFVDGVPSDEKKRDKLKKKWGVLFRKLGDVAELKDEHGEPYGFSSHSLRHTFVYWALNKGLPTEDVAALIGDTVQVVARHYSAWIAGRQERLNERMMEALK